MDNRDEITKQVTEITTNILKQYITKIEDMEHYLQLEEIMINMLEELRNKSLCTLIDGEKMLVTRIVKDLIQYDENFKDYPLNYDKLTWITREFHDNEFDFDSFENGVKKAMIYTLEDYEE